jgi:hypothetical protein
MSASKGRRRPVTRHGTPIPSSGRPVYGQVHDAGANMATLIAAGRPQIRTAG